MTGYMALPAPARPFVPDVSPALTKVMVATVFVHHLDGRCTVRSVAEAAGLSTATTYSHLCHLRRRGLVAWERGRAGTLRPLVAAVAHG